MKISKSGKPITSVDSWFLYAPPKKGKKQWDPGRSAMELARSFCAVGEPCVPPELQALLDSRQQLGHIELTDAWPEHVIELDAFRGETRNADLAAVGNCALGRVAVTVEAKADESFGEQIGSELRGLPENSNKPKRIDALSKALFGTLAESLSQLRYQLLHGAAASAIFAKEQGASVGVFAMMEFQSPSCSRENLMRNAGDLQRFLTLLGYSASLQPGHLVGPFMLPGSERISPSIPLYIGKAVKRLA